MTAAVAVKWNMEADYLQACNCDYGCPCEFEAPPTMGFCEGMGAWRINSGRYGDVALDGLGLGFALHFPGPMHQGNGTMVALIDEKASPPQREALRALAHGEAGGMPFEVFRAITTKWLEPQSVPFEFHFDGRNSRVRIGQAINVAVEPIRNPVSGVPESIRTEHATGFMFKTAEVVSARECRVAVGELNFSYPHKTGFVAHVKYGN